jgi:agmatinase
MNKFRDLIVENIEESKLILVGLPYDASCSVGKGASLAPKIIRDLSGFLPPFTMDQISIEDFKIYDYGDIEITKNYHNKVEKITKLVFELNKFPLFIGGDHSVSIPIQKNFIEQSKKKGLIPVIIHIDAHPDICDVYENSKYSHACTNMRAIENGLLTSNLNLIGIRGFEKQEVEYFDNYKEINLYLASEMNEKGYEYVLDDLVNKYQDPKFACYLSYDIDANDPSFAPGTGTPEAFGLDSYKLMKLIKGIIKKLNVTAMDIVEVSPPLDVNNITSWLALKTLYEIFAVLNEKIKEK